jgi:DNA-binding NarL/FixJ family response regulator
MRRVLIVDDDPLVRRSLARELSSVYDEVLVAGTIEEARELCDGAPEPLYAVATDLGLAAGPLAGLDLLEETRQRWPECARVLISGTVTATEVEPWRAAGTVQGFVMKPWTRGAVAEAIDRARGSGP